MSHDDQGWRSEKSQFVAAVAERIRCRRPVDCFILKWCKGPPDLLGLFRWVLVQARIILSACATHPLYRSWRLLLSRQTSTMGEGTERSLLVSTLNPQTSQPRMP